MTKRKPADEPAQDQRAVDRAAELERQQAVIDAVAAHNAAELERLAAPGDDDAGEH